MFYLLLFADVLGGNDLYSQDRETASQEVKRLALAEFEADVSTMTNPFTFLGTTKVKEANTFCSGSLTDPDPDPAIAISVSDLQDASKKIFFTFFAF